jgi:dihydroorotate dehydrogenase
MAWSPPIRRSSATTSRVCRYADEAGGLSGRPLRARATAVVARLAKALDGALPIIGVGGILSGADAKEKIDAGATLVQIYTGLIYRGPDLIAECARAIAGQSPSA